MPNRMLRDWTQSDKVDSISCEAERFFTRLIMKVDDYGCFWADGRLVKANLFPLKLDRIREADITRWMVECQKAGLIVLYECNEKRYLQILDFKQRLDRAKAKFPLPPKELIELMKQSTDFPEVVNDFLAELEVEKKTETEEKGITRVAGGFVSNGYDESIVFSIEHCLIVSMKDTRWVKANKIIEDELKEFNGHLEKQGVYEKNPRDYKRHFANWKRAGKKDDSGGIKQQNNSAVNAREEKARKLLNL